MSSPEGKMPGEGAPAGAPRNRERSLDLSVRDGAAHAAMIGLGEFHNLSLFAIFLGATPLELAILASFPPLLGSLSQLASVRLLDRFRARKPIVLWPAILQAANWPLFFLLPFLFSGTGIGIAFLVLAAGLHYALGSAQVPAWSAWMGDLVPEDRRGAFFGRRESRRFAALLVTIPLSGGVLALASRLGFEAFGFALVFLAAAAARIVSARAIAGMEEPPPRPPGPDAAFSLWEFVRRAPRTDFGRFAIYLALMQVAMGFAGAFYNPYMKRGLGFTYLELAAVFSAPMITQAVMFGIWGRLADRVGNRRVFAAAGLAISALPLLWIVSPRFGWIVGVQAVSGVVWAAFWLSTGNYFYDAVSPEKRARCAAFSQILSTAGFFAGSTLAGFAAPALPGLIDRLDLWAVLPHPFLALFLACGVARLVISLLLLPAIRERRKPPAPPVAEADPGVPPGEG